MNKLLVGLLAAILVVQAVILLKPSKPANLIVQTPAQAEQAMGSAADVTTNWTAGDFSEDVTVGDDLTVAGDVSVTGEASGLVTVRSIAMASATTTCAIQNTSGVDHIVVDASALFASTTGALAGTFHVTAGTSTNAYNTSSYPMIATQVTTINGAPTWTPTSTLRGTAEITARSGIWRNGEWFTFKVGASSLGAGFCKLSYY